jgi:GABA(A) receptor-associated protein
MTKIQNLLNKYPDRIPIVLSSKTYLKDNPLKFIVPYEQTIAQFMVLLRTKIQLKPEEAIFFFVKDTETGQDIMVQTSSTIEYLYTQYKDKDLLLNLFFEKESVFG